MMNVENNYNVTDLGNVAPNPKGEYRPGVTYEYLDWVTIDGSTYLCIVDQTTVKPTPGQTTTEWMLTTQSGKVTQEYKQFHDEVVQKAQEVQTTKEAVDTKASQVSTDKQAITEMKSDITTKHDTVVAAQADVTSKQQDVDTKVTEFTNTVTTQTNSSVKKITDQETSTLNQIKSEGTNQVNAIKAEKAATDAKLAKAVYTEADAVAGSGVQVDPAWLVDDKGKKVSPNVRLQQVSLPDGTKFEDKYNADLEGINTKIDNKDYETLQSKPAIDGVVLNKTSTKESLGLVNLKTKGTAGQFAVSDGLGGIDWVTLTPVEEVAY